MTIEAREFEHIRTRIAAQTWIELYAIMGLLTLAFQLWVRSSQCVGLEGCGPSYAKAIVWAAIWPASWVVYLPGVLPGLGS